MNTESVEQGQRSMCKARFVSPAPSKVSRLQNKWVNKNLIILDENCMSDSFQALHNLQIPISSFKAKKYAQDQICYVGTFKAQERLNKQRILFVAGTLNFWAPLSDQNIRIIRLTYSIKDTIEQLDFIITKITQNSGQQYDCAMNNMQKIPYFLACQKIYRMYINKFKRENTQNGQIIHHKAYCFK